MVVVCKLVMQFLDLGSHLHAQLRVEVRERLVEQEHGRIAHDRAPHRHALALTAGQLLRLAVEIRRQIEDRSRPLHLAPDFVLRQLFSCIENAMLSNTLKCA